MWPAGCPDVKQKGVNNTLYRRTQKWKPIHVFQDVNLIRRFVLHYFQIFPKQPVLGHYIWWIILLWKRKRSLGIYVTLNCIASYKLMILPKNATLVGKIDFKFENIVGGASDAPPVPTKWVHDLYTKREFQQWLLIHINGCSVTLFPMGLTNLPINKQVLIRSDF